MPTGLIVGCGYLGRRVAQKWLDAGRVVYVLTRNPENAAAFAAAGLCPLVGDVTEPDSLPELPIVDTVLFAVGWDRSTNKSPYQVHVDGLSQLLERLRDHVRRIIYISSTGVYSQTDDQWIDESSPAEPTRDSGKACLQAEQLLLQSRFADRAVVLRLAGIYGPQRVPQKQIVTANQPIQVDPDGYLNLIHVDDAVSAVLAAELIQQTPTTILVCDDQPVLRRDYYSEVARLYHAPPPRFATPDKQRLTQQRGGTSKRVRNDKLKTQLAFKFAYPNYREGLAAILEQAD